MGDDRMTRFSPLPRTKITFLPKNQKSAERYFFASFQFKVNSFPNIHTDRTEEKSRKELRPTALNFFFIQIEAQTLHINRLTRYLSTSLSEKNRSFFLIHYIKLAGIERSFSTAAAEQGAISNRERRT